jgi:hypothetical protein
MKRSAKLYFGMTQTQIAILGCLAFIIILVLGIFGYLITSGSSIYAAPPAAPVQELASETATIPAATETPVPTLDPALPTTVPVPATPPAGWVIFQSTGVELWLPNNFVGGDMLNKRSETIQRVNRLGKFYVNAVALMRKADKSTMLFMVDKSKQTVLIPVAMVNHITLTDDLSLKDYIDREYASDKTVQTTINENKKTTLLGREARRLTVQVRQPTGLEGLLIAYVIKEGPEIWIVSYNLPPNEIINLSPMIDQSIATFNILK